MSGTAVAAKGPARSYSPIRKVSVSSKPDEASDAVKVVVRIRPMVGRELLQRCTPCLSQTQDPNQVVVGSDHCFTFDSVLDASSSQEACYNTCAGPLLTSIFEGYNATILAYGQTGSGKTFTMGTGGTDGGVDSDDPNVGIVPRVIHEIFSQTESRKESTPGSSFNVRVQFLELYGDDLRDLLCRNPVSGKPLAIREDEHGSMQIVGAREVVVSSCGEALRCLNEGCLARTTGSTMMNEASSRSHAIFTMTLEQRLPMGVAGAAGSSDTPRTLEVRTAKFHFVDLAGSERAKKTMATGQRLKEGISINQGLLALGNVISALGDDKRRGTATHVPYRDSKLTRMLQDSLGGNARTVMVACVSPADDNFDESLTTLRYANRARNICNKPVANKDMEAIQINALKQEIEALRAALSHAQPRGGPETIASPTAHPIVHSLLSLLGLDGNVSNMVLVEEVSKLRQARDDAESLKSRVQELESDVSKTKLAMKKWKKRFGQEEDARVEAEARAAYLEHQLLAGGREPFPASNRSKPLGQDCGTATTEATGQMSVPTPAVLSETYTVIERQVRRIQALERQVQELRDGGATNRDTPRTGRRNSLSSTKPSVVGGSGNPGEGHTDSEDDDAIAAVQQAQTIPVEEDVPVEAPQFQRILRRLSIGPTTVAAEFKPFMFSPPATIPESVDEDGLDTPEVDAQPLDELLSNNDTFRRVIAEEHAVREAEEEFHRRQSAMAKNIDDYGRTIGLKEEWLRELERKEAELEDMRTFYEGKLSEMKDRVATLERQRSDIISDLKTTQSLDSTSSSDRDPKLQETLEHKLRETEKQLAELKSKQRDLERIADIKSKMGKEVLALKDSITELRRQRARQEKVFEKERSQFKDQLESRRKEIASLKKEKQLTEERMQKLEEEARKREAVLRKQMESSSVMKRSKSAMRPPRAGSRMKSRAETSKAVEAVAKKLQSKPAASLSPALSKLKSQLEAAVQRNVEQANVVESLQKRLQAREQDLRMLEELIVQRDTLLKGKRNSDESGRSSDLAGLDIDLASEIDQYFAGDSKGSAASPRVSHSRLAAIASPLRTTLDLGSRLPTLQVDTGNASSSALREMFITPRDEEGIDGSGRLLSEEEQELLSELDDRIEACQAKIHFTEQQIIALAPETTVSEVVEEPKVPAKESTMLSALSALSETDDMSELSDVDVSGAGTLPEAKSMLKLLFRMLVDMKRSERNNVSVKGELELRIQELEAEIEGKKNSMIALQLEFERRKTELEAEHDKETSWLVRLHTQLRSSLTANYTGDADSVEDVVKFVQTQDLRITCLEGELQASTASLARASADRDALQDERDKLRKEVNTLTEALLKAREAELRREVTGVRAGIPSVSPLLDADNCVVHGTESPPKRKSLTRAASHQVLQGTPDRGASGPATARGSKGSGFTMKATEPTKPKPSKLSNTPRPDDSFAEDVSLSGPLRVRGFSMQKSGTSGPEQDVTPKPPVAPQEEGWVSERVFAGAKRPHTSAGTKSSHSHSHSDHSSAAMIGTVGSDPLSLQGFSMDPSSGLYRRTDSRASLGKGGERGTGAPLVSAVSVFNLKGTAATSATLEPARVLTARSDSSRAADPPVPPPPAQPSGSAKRSSLGKETPLGRVVSVAHLLKARSGSSSEGPRIHTSDLSPNILDGISGVSPTSMAIIDKIAEEVAAETLEGIEVRKIDLRESERDRVHSLDDGELDAILAGDILPTPTTSQGHHKQFRPMEVTVDLTPPPSPLLNRRHG